MKNVIIPLCGMLILFFSCKKETEPIVKDVQSGTKKYAVKFAVSGFKQEVGVFATLSNAAPTVAADTSTLSNLINNLIYIIYDKNGVEVSRYKQNENGTEKYIIPPGTRLRNYDFDSFNNNTVFGSLSDSLEAGTYTVVIIGYRGSFDDISLNSRSEGAAGTRASSLGEASFTYTRGLNSYPRARDTFFKKISITVDGSDINENVVLERIVGRLAIYIEDKIPSNASYYRFIFDEEKDGYLFNTETPTGGVDNDETSYTRYLVEEQDKGQSNFSKQFTGKLFINTETPLKVEISCFDAADSLLATKTVNARIYKNKTTVLKGKLFSSPSAAEQAFQVGLNNEWDCDSSVVNF